MDFAKLTSDADQQQLCEILSQSFRMSSDYWGGYVRRIGRDDFRILRSDNKIIGGLGMYRMGQWFGGQCLDTAGIAAVGIAPEHRAAGAAAQLMSSTLNELYDEGTPLAALYASTQRLYRKVGFEQAGCRYQYKLALDSIGQQGRDAAFHRIHDTEHERYHELARARAVITNGNLERNNALWERMVTFPYEDRTIYRYVIGDLDAPEGYLFYYQDAAARGPYNLIVRDMVALTPRASRGLWAFFASHRSLADSVIWHGPAVEPLLMLPGELDVEIASHMFWMLRIVNVQHALTQRGYPPYLTAELHFDIQDPIIAANNGRFVLSVTDGSATLQPGGDGRLRASINAIAPLFSGFAEPARLRALGQIDADDASVDTASQLFAGAEPWMADMF